MTLATTPSYGDLLTPTVVTVAGYCGGGPTQKKYINSMRSGKYTFKNILFYTFLYFFIIVGKGYKIEQNQVAQAFY